MAIRVGINGFGRIGRNVLRASLHDKEIDFVAVNDITDAPTLAHLLKYDSILGNLPDEVKAVGDEIHVAGRKIKVLAMKDPAQLPWKALGVEYVIESTGLFTDADKAKAHISAGAKKVIISAPAKGEDITIVLGVNQDKYDPKQAQRRLERLLHDELPGAGGEGAARRVRDRQGPDDHDPQLHERPEDPRPAAQGPAPRARGGAVDDPHLDRRGQGDRPRDPRAEGQAGRRRDPRPDAERLDGRPDGRSWRSRPRAEEINAALKQAASGPMKGVLDVTDEELVSIDFRGNPHSSIVDAGLTKVVDGTLVKVFAWYDNEWGFSSRVRDLIHFMAKRDHA